MAETETLSNKKPRPIIRIGLFIISHSLVVSIVCCIAGVLALLLLPVVAKNTYFSENALMPGSVTSMLSLDSVSEADRFVRELTTLGLKPSPTGIEIPTLIARHMAELGGDVSYHNFHPELSKFHPPHFFSSPDPGVAKVNYSCSSYGVNTIGIVRAPRGDGKESIVLVTPYNSSHIGLGEALSLGVAYSVFSLLTHVSWLAKDIIWLAADSRHGEYAAVVSWLKDYHTPSFGGLEKLNAKVCRERLVTGSEVSDSFKRAGTMAAALVIKVTDKREEFDKDSLRIYAEASNGQMPNLDLINIVNYLAAGQGFRVKVQKLLSFLDSKWLKFLGGTVESLGKMARDINPDFKFGIPVAEYIEGTATLASSLYNQALGVPTGSHGAFRDYQVDAVTLEISPKISSYNKAKRNEFLLHCARLVEGVTRSVNNLLEKFHQSFFLYLLTAPNKFVSVGVYMIAFVLLIAPLPVVAASLYSDATKCSPAIGKDKGSSSSASADVSAVKSTSWKWLYAAKTVFIVHIWGFIVTVLPYFICQIPDCPPSTCFIIWVLISGFSQGVLHLVLGSPSSFVSVPQPLGKEWLLLKSVTITAAFIGLYLMSVINFATAELGALLMVPMCLMVAPLRKDLKGHSLKALTRAACNLAFVLVGFPAVTFFLLQGAFEGFDGINIGDFWYWIESLWEWNSATYIYMCMAYVPCWVLCIHILLHPC